MHRLTSLCVALLFGMGLPRPAASEPQNGASSAAPVELRITGPHLIHLGDTLRFTATLTNRSDQPIALRYHFGAYDDTRFVWRVTDAGHRLLPPHVYDGPPMFICPVVGPVTDRQIIILKPGESTQTELGDPSDEFAFTGKGFYRVTLTYRLVPTHGEVDGIVVCKFCPAPDKSDAYTPEQKVEMLKKTGYIQVVSKEWHMYLTD
jgi:hypothetical protein